MSIYNFFFCDAVVGIDVGDDDVGDGVDAVDAVDAVDVVDVGLGDVGDDSVVVGDDST